jgi:hypothetical protein
LITNSNLISPANFLALRGRNESAHGELKGVYVRLTNAVGRAQTWQVRGSVEFPMGWLSNHSTRQQAQKPFAWTKSADDILAIGCFRRTTAVENAATYH